MSCRDALLTDSDLRADGPCHQRDCTSGTLEPIYHRYSCRASTLTVTTTGRQEQLEDLAAAAAGARATRMSLLWAGRSSWRTWAGATQRYRDLRLHNRRERADRSV